MIKVHEQNPTAEEVYTRKQRHHSTYIYSFTSVSYDRSSFQVLRLHGVLLFQNKYDICLAIYSLQCESLMSHLQVRVNEVEMLYFRSKLPDPARDTNSEHLGNVFVFVWA